MAYFSSKCFPTAAVFAQLERKEQDMIARSCKTDGLQTAVERLDWLRPRVVTFKPVGFQCAVGLVPSQAK